MSPTAMVLIPLNNSCISGLQEKVERELPPHSRLQGVSSVSLVFLSVLRIRMIYFQTQFQFCFVGFHFWV